MKKILIVLFILAPSFFFMGCREVTIDPKPTAFSLAGNVAYNSIGLPDVELTLSGNDEEYTVVCDDEGDFLFTDIPEGIYTLYPEKTGFTFTPSIYYVDIDQDITDRTFTAGSAPGFRIDPWGYAWDDILRAASTWEQAKAFCESLGGRLPTPTELYRNYHSNPNGHGGTISQPDESYHLWTIIPHNLSDAVSVRLDDGHVANYSKTRELYFRCVWPDKNYNTFRKNYLYGPPGENGFQVKINGGLFYMDTYDRPPLSYNSAVREAAFYHAYIPPQSVYTAVIQDGLPNGSNNWLWTSDHEGSSGTNFLVGLVRWQDTDTGFDDTYPTYSDWGYIQDDNPFRFRCAGVSKVLQPNPKDLANEYTDTHSLLKTTRGDQGVVTMFNAIQTCFDSGGHLPAHQEYMILVQSGLPNGSGNYLWTSEYEDNDTVGEIRWSTVDYDFTGYHSTYMSWVEHTTNTRQYRTVYHPIDGDYNGPDESDCYGGRFEVVKDLGNGNAVRIWTDLFDRDAATYQDAIQQCHTAGGHLASRRDLVELIVNGLPNGTGNWIWTSDKARFDQIELIRWSGTYDPETSTYADQWSADATDETHNGVIMYPFRCVWTNEVRIR